MKKKTSYIVRYVYVPKEQRAFFKEKLGKDPTGKDFVQALVEKLSTV